MCHDLYEYSLTWNLYTEIKSNEISCLEVSILVKKSVSWHAFFRALNPILKTSQLGIKWHGRVQTLVKKSGSCLRERLWLEMVVVFLSGLRPCQAFFTIVKGLGGKVRRGAAQPPGERKSGGGCSFRRGTEGRKTFLLMWLACALMPDFSCLILASLSHLTLSSSRLCLSDHGTSMSVSGRLWGQQTPV